MNKLTVNNVQLGLVESSDLNENVLGVQADLGMVTVDNGRQRANSLLGVVNDWVDWAVSNDVQVFAQLLMLLY